MGGKSIPRAALLTFRAELFGKQHEPTPPDLYDTATGQRTMARDSNRNDDHVGYRNPPRHARFIKGQSGNPKGRPPRPIADDRIEDQPTLAVFLKDADRLVTVREGDKRSEILMREALTRSIWNAAIKGNPAAMRLAVEMLISADVLHAARIQEEHDFAQRYRDHCEELDRKAKAAGQPPSRHIPHPDDLIIEDGKRLRFRYLSSLEAYDELDTLHRIRDILLMQDVFDQRMNPRQSSQEKSGGALLLALLVNDTLPKRMQDTDTEIFLKTMRHSALSKSVLLKTLYRDWRSVGARPRRGTTLPPLARTRAQLGIYFDYAINYLRDCKQSVQ